MSAIFMKANNFFVYCGRFSYTVKCVCILVLVQFFLVAASGFKYGMSLADFLTVFTIACTGPFSVVFSLHRDVLHQTIWGVSLFQYSIIAVVFMVLHPIRPSKLTAILAAIGYVIWFLFGVGGTHEFV